jgi:hypothetical protein
MNVDSRKLAFLYPGIQSERHWGVFIMDPVSGTPHYTATRCARSPTTSAASAPPSAADSTAKSSDIASQRDRAQAATQDLTRGLPQAVSDTLV